jgi:hypothetical protein
MTKSLAKTDLAALLAAADGSYVEAYNRLVAKVEAEVIATSRRSTVADRKDRWSKALATMDRGVLAKINITMKGYLGQVRKQTITAAEEPRQITDEEATALMGEYLALRDIDEFLKVRREFMKQVIFTHLTESFAEDGEEFPEHLNGEIEVAELGHKFVRQGTGRKDPVLDEDALAEKLGDAWDDVTEIEIIPEQITRRLSVERLMKVAETNPAILEQVRKALTVGEWKNPSFVVRPITPE